MNAPRYITLVNGLRTLVSAITQSVGNASGFKIVATRVDGKIDPTFLPPEVEVQTEAIAAAEAIGAGRFINIYNDAGIRKIRNADASNGREAHGFVLSAVAIGEIGTVYKSGANTALSGNSGAKLFLSATSAGEGSSSAPDLAAGVIIQTLGFFDDGNSFTFRYESPVVVE